MTGAVTAAAALAVSAGVGIYSAVNASKVSGQAMGQSGTIFGEQQSYEQQLQQLMANPSSVTQLPGYQFQLEQGTQAVARQMGAAGMFGSGNEAAALTQYGQGLASSFYQQQVNNLMSLSGITAPESPAQATGAAVAANTSTSNQIQGLLGQLGIAYGLGGGNNGIFSGSSYSSAATPGSGGYPLTTAPPAALYQSGPITGGWMGPPS